jgi:hypothetical protein
MGGALTVGLTKFGKLRLVPLHLTTSATPAHLRPNRRDRHLRPRCGSTVIVAEQGGWSISTHQRTRGHTHDPSRVLYLAGGQPSMLGPRAATSYFGGWLLPGRHFRGPSYMRFRLQSLQAGATLVLSICVICAMAFVVILGFVIPILVVTFCSTIPDLFAAVGYMFAKWRNRGQHDRATTPPEVVSDAWSVLRPPQD